MIDISTFEAITPYIDHNTSKAIVAIPGSTLSTLTQSLIEKGKFVISSIPKDQLREEFTTDDAIKVVNTASIDCKENHDTHQLLLDKTVDDVARVMRNNVYLARAVVLPLIDKYADRLSEVVSLKCNRNVLALNIVEDKKRSILASPQLSAIVDDQKERTNYVDITLPRHHDPEVSVPELVALLKTGNKGFDEVVSNWITVNSLDETVQAVYRNIFVRASGVSNNFASYINHKDHETSLITLLLCWGLVAKVQDGISISLDTYKDQMEVLSSACSGMLSQSIRNYERSVKSKNLVIQYPASNRQFCYDAPEKNCIIVDTQTYATFLGMGGTPEMIFGSYLTDRTLNAEGILQDAAKYIKEYDKQMARGRLTTINNTITVVSQELRLIAFDIVKDIEGSDGSNDCTLVSDCELRFTGSVHLEKANRFIHNLNIHDLDDYYALLRRFICSCYFEGSMVQALLDRIDKLDPNGANDVNEMALVATTDLIVDWLVNQIETDTRSVSLEGYYKE